MVFGQASGCLGTAVVSPALTVVPQPPSISAIEACTIPTVFLTADACLRLAAQVQPGDRCLIHAATGKRSQPLLPQHDLVCITPDMLSAWVHHLGFQLTVCPA